MYQARMNEVFAGMNAESARWGDNRRPGNSYTRAEWFAYQQRILNEYFPVRTGNVLNQLKTRNLYPSIGAPTFSSYGGTFAGAVSLTMANPGAGTIYYTTEGSDPRLAGGGLNSTAIPTAGRSTSARHDDSRACSTERSGKRFRKRNSSAPPAVRISEVMYHPRDASGTYLPDDFEFIERKIPALARSTSREFNSPGEPRLRSRIWSFPPARGH
jgi:hypothetical protein